MGLEALPGRGLEGPLAPKALPDWPPCRDSPLRRDFAPCRDCAPWVRQPPGRRSPELACAPHVKLWRGGGTSSATWLCDTGGCAPLRALDAATRMRSPKRASSARRARNDGASYGSAPESPRPECVRALGSGDASDARTACREQTSRAEAPRCPAPASRTLDAGPAAGAP